MEEFINNIVEFIKQEAANNNPVLVVFLASLIVIIESIIPLLPLALFIALNMLIFGNIWGFVISWISTIIGCILSFYIFRLGFDKYIYKFIGNRALPNKLIDKIDHIKFKHLVLITALPFTPSFAVNIASGMSHMSFKKFLLNIVIAKVSIVYFWGYIGKSFLESITDINTLIKLGLILVVMYLISHYITKKLNIE